MKELQYYQILASSSTISLRSSDSDYYDYDDMNDYDFSNFLFNDMISPGWVELPFN